MGPHEIWTRLRQEFTKRSDEARHRIGLPPAREPLSLAPQPEGQFFFTAADLPQLAALVLERLPREASRIVVEADKIRRHRFDLLGYKDLDFGEEMNWHLDPVHEVCAPRSAWFHIPFLDFALAGDHKVVWELNRHQHLVTLGKAWLLKGDTRYVDELILQWRHWQDQNPYPLGINWASSLEVAFRSLSWLWLRHMLATCAVVTEEFRQDLLRALGQNARHIERFLSTYFAPNTHLLGEGVALFFIGTLCPQFASAPRWRQKGWRIVLHEARRQVRNDGMHFEQSVYYHVYALDFFLHARILAERNGIEMPPELDETIEKMAELLRVLSQAGALPRFGDDDGGRVFDPRRNGTEHLLDPLSTAAVLYERGDFKAAAGELREETLWLLGPEGTGRFDALRAEMRTPVSSRGGEGGFYSMVGTEPVLRQVVIDAGPHGAGRGGHGHADALSLQCIARGRHWLTDPGACCYPRELPERDRFRGTAAHNTLRVDGLDQADPAGPFSWRFLPETRVERWVAGETFDLFAGSHDGYHRLPEPVTHRRWVVSWKSGAFLVRDLALGKGTHTLDLYWHPDPAFSIEPLGPGALLAVDTEGRGMMIVTVEADSWSREILEGEWSAVYGHKTAAPAVRYGRHTALPAEFTTLFVPLADPAPASPAPRLERLRVGQPVAVYRYDGADGSRLLWFSDEDRGWEWKGWASDAAFLCFSRGPSGAQDFRVSLAGGSYLEIGGRRALTCRGKVDYWEWICTESREETFCAETSLVDGFALDVLRAVPAV